MSIINSCVVAHQFAIGKRKSKHLLEVVVLSHMCVGVVSQMKHELEQEKETRWSM